MTRRGNKIWNKLLYSDSLVYTFSRSIVSSQAASWLDIILGFILFAAAGMSAFWSAAMGAVAGGILNCVINYRFTFHAAGCSRKAVAVKYAMVWIGSVLLNSFGTELLYTFLHEWHLDRDLGISADACYAVARLTVSLLVSLLWNFGLQRVFVYRTSPADRWCIAFVDFFLPKRLRSPQTAKGSQTTI